VTVFTTHELPTPLREVAGEADEALLLLLILITTIMMTMMVEPDNRVVTDLVLEVPSSSNAILQKWNKIVFKMNDDPAWIDYGKK
jgi:hypothetical protein